MAFERRGPAGWAVHPGEILREEFMKPARLSSYRLAKLLRTSAPRINDIVLERRGVTADTAIRLAKFFGTTEQFWMNLQAAYDIHQARRQGAKALAKIQPLSDSAA